MKNAIKEVGFDDTFKADNLIFSIVLKANGMRDECCFQNMYKTLIRPQNIM